MLNPADPADVESTVSLVDDELERMNRMVSDPAAAGAIRAARIPAPPTCRCRGADQGRVRQGGLAWRSRFRAGSDRRSSGHPRSTADHPGAGRTRRQRVPLHRTRRPDCGGVHARPWLAPVLDRRLGTRCQRPGPIPQDRHRRSADWLRRHARSARRSRPGMLSSNTSPPCATAMARTIARPSNNEQSTQPMIRVRAANGRRRSRSRRCGAT